MSKYIITNNNIPYNYSYKNVIYFGTEEARDEFIDTNLLPNYKQQLENRPNVSLMLTDNVSNEIKVDYRYNLIKNKNYIIIKDVDGNVSFHFILSITNGDNNNVCYLTLVKDLNMTYPNIWDKIKNVQTTQTHLDNYFGFEMDGGSKKIVNVSNVPYTNFNEVYSQLQNNTWLVVMERVNNEGDYISKISNGNDYKEPYKIYIAPLKGINVKEGEVDETILYEQSNPTNYYITLKDEESDINLGLSSPINTDLDLNIYYRTNKGTGDKKYSYSTKVLKEWMPININENTVIVLPFDVNSNHNALDLNTRLINNEIINEDIIFNELDIGTTAKLYFVPLRITKNSDLNYSFSTIKVSELLEKIPNVMYSNSPTNGGQYYKNLTDTQKNQYGLYYGNLSWNISFTKISQVQQSVWSADNLFNYLEDNENTQIITAKITNFIPIDTNQTEGVFSLLNANNIAYDESNGIYYLRSLNYDKLLSWNTHTIDVSNFSKYDLISGLNKYSLAIENQKEFEIDANFIDVETKTLTFKHYASFTPNWEERFKYNNSFFVSDTNDENSFTNSKEFIKGVDQLAQYKVNNPVSSKLEWLKPITKPASLFFIQNAFTSQKVGAGGIGSEVLNRRGRVSDSEIIDVLERAVNHGTDLKIKGFESLKGIASFVGDLGSIYVNRANLKRQPEEFQGNGDINGDLIFNNNGMILSLYEYQFLTPLRESIIWDIKKYGINTTAFLSTLWTYKQTSFNFYVLENLDNTNNKELIETLSPQEYDMFNGICQSGFTLWYDYSKFLDWESNDERF